MRPLIRAAGKAETGAKDVGLALEAADWLALLLEWEEALDGGRAMPPIVDYYGHVHPISPMGAMAAELRRQCTYACQPLRRQTGQI